MNIAKNHDGGAHHEVLSLINWRVRKHGSCNNYAVSDEEDDADDHHW